MLFIVYTLINICHETYHKNTHYLKLKRYILFFILLIGIYLNDFCCYILCIFQKRVVLTNVDMRVFIKRLVFWTLNNWTLVSSCVLDLISFRNERPS